MYNRIQNVIGKLGFELIEVDSFPHKDDTFLKLVVAKNTNKDEFVCWVYNDNDEAVYEGYYTNSYESAYEKLKKRKAG